MKAIIISTQDKAGMNMLGIYRQKGFKENSEQFRENPVLEFEDFKLYLIDESQVFVQGLDEINAELIIFSSRHSSAAGKKSLTVHPIGNWGKAELGGEDKKLVKTSAKIMKNYLLGLKKKAKEFGLDDYSVCYEATHHGPFLNTPTVFIEVGGTEKEWNDLKACRAVVETVLESTNENCKCKIAIGLGGNHYADNFTKVALRTDIAFGHMCPKYALENFDKEMLDKAIEKTCEKAEAIVLDYKSLKNKQVVKELCEKKGLEILRTEKILKKN